METDQVDPRGVALLRSAGLEPRPDLIVTANGYLARARKARKTGVWLAILTAAFGLTLIPNQQAFAMTAAQLFAGYLVGSVVASSVLERSRTTTIRTASLSRRTASSLLPSWARALPWITLIPCAACPLLLLGHHPTLTETVRQGTGSAMKTLTWFSPSTLTAISATAAVALVTTIVVTRRLARRRLQVDDPALAHLDLVTRAMSARATAGSASALGIAMLAGICYIAHDVLGSYDCTRDPRCRLVYDFPVLHQLAEIGSGLLSIGSVLFFAFALRPVLPHSLRSGPGAMQ